MTSFCSPLKLGLDVSRHQLFCFISALSSFLQIYFSFIENQPIQMKFNLVLLTINQFKGQCQEQVPLLAFAVL